MTISTPIWGKLADLTNRKVLIQVALVVAVVSSALAGLSLAAAFPGAAAVTRSYLDAGAHEVRAFTENVLRN